MLPSNRAAEDCLLEVAQFSRLTPLPGMAQWKQFEAEDRLIERDWSKYSFQNVVYRPKQMNMVELNQARSRCLVRILQPATNESPLVLNRPPIDEEILLWALHSGISRIMRSHSRNHGNQVRAQEQAQSCAGQLNLGHCRQRPPI